MTPWTVALQAPLSSRQEYWSGFPFPSPGDFPDPGIKPVSLVFPALKDPLQAETPGKPPSILLQSYSTVFYHILFFQMPVATH